MASCLENSLLVDRDLLVWWDFSHFLSFPARTLIKSRLEYVRFVGASSYGSGAI